MLALAHTVNDSYAYILPPLLPLLLEQAGLTLGMGAALVAIQRPSPDRSAQWPNSGCRNADASC